MNSKTYAIDCGDGWQLAAGISAHEIDRVAQERADRLGQSVWVYRELDDDSEAREVRPTKVEVELDSANGPRVTYGEHEIDDVEAALPEGWTMDWESSHQVSPPGATPVRYVAAIHCGRKRDVLSWYHAASYVATFPDDGGEGACDVRVEIGRAGLSWFLRTSDDAGGSDECDDTAYSSEDAAIAAALEYAEDHHEADPGEPAADYLERMRAEVSA